MKFRNKYPDAKPGDKFKEKTANGAVDTIYFIDKKHKCGVCGGPFSMKYKAHHDVPRWSNFRSTHFATAICSEECLAWLWASWQQSQANRIEMRLLPPDPIVWR